MFYRKPLRDTKELPRIEVSRKEFIELYIANGGSKESSEFQAKMSEMLKSHCMIGDKMVKSLGEIDEASGT